MVRRVREAASRAGDREVGRVRGIRWVFLRFVWILISLMIIVIPSYRHNEVSEEDCVSSWYSLFIFGGSCQQSVQWYLDCGVHRWGVERSFELFESISNHNVTSNT